MTQSSSLWTASRLGKFHWRDGDDGEEILFHSASGGTHVLSAPAAAILKELEHRSLAFEEIVQCVTISLGDAHDDSLADQVKQLLDEFDQLGLIEPVS